MDATVEGQDGAALHLAELACARICHDMSGLLGTLAGALELLSDEIGEGSETCELATDAAREMSQRLRLLRAAWGGGCDAADPTRLAELAVGLPAARRVKADLAGLARVALPAPAARVALCLLIAGAEALPGGGTVMLSGDARRLEARLDGPRAGWPPAVAEWATGSSPVPEGPRDLAAPMLALAVRAAGMRLVLAGPGVPTLAAEV